MWLKTGKAGQSLLIQICRRLSGRSALLKLGHKLRQESSNMFRMVEDEEKDKASGKAKDDGEREE